ncbi:recombinase family protein [Mesorhizobium sp.]|uniref:recombinase family protein n=1 Tax=Mesorhizobium sp. TaxID=1871066 RepID=UPI0025B895AC|nr:recombinase family protein [Mesorhizobium sp.]
MEAQQGDIELFLQNYSDVPYEVVTTFQDIGSGADNGRPQLQKAIALAQKQGANWTGSPVLLRRHADGRPEAQTAGCQRAERRQARPKRRLAPVIEAESAEAPITCKAGEPTRTTRKRPPCSHR